MGWKSCLWCCCSCWACIISIAFLLILLKLSRGLVRPSSYFPPARLSHAWFSFMFYLLCPRLGDGRSGPSPCGGGGLTMSVFLTDRFCRLEEKCFLNYIVNDQIQPGDCPPIFGIKYDRTRLYIHVDPLPHFTTYNNYATMKLPVWLLLLATLHLASPIYLPLVPKRPRCMMVYTIGEVESVKFDIVLPELPSQGSEENYLLTLRNTETEQSKAETVAFGSYKREHELTPNVIYEFCMQLNTGRNIDDVAVSYNAETVFHIDHSEMKVPENLLKKEDFKGTYEAAYRIGETVQSYTQMQKERDISANNNFEATKSVDKKLIAISVVEIVIIVAAGVYQYYSLQNYLTSKQYI